MITVSTLRVVLEGLPGDWLVERNAVGNVVLVEPRTKAWLGYLCLATGNLEIFTEGEGE